MTDITTIRPRQLKEAMRSAIKNNHPILVVGKPGIGKTAITYQTAKELQNDIKPLFPAVADPTVFMGMPYYDNDAKEATFLPYGAMKDLIITKQ